MKAKYMFALFVLLFAAAPLASVAEGPPQPVNAPAQSTDAKATSPEAMAPGCPGAEDGKCCGACQQRARLAKKPAAEMAGCPCQRARQAGESK